MEPTAQYSQNQRNAHQRTNMEIRSLFSLSFFPTIPLKLRTDTSPPTRISFSRLTLQKMDDTSERVASNESAEFQRNNGVYPGVAIMIQLQRLRVYLARLNPPMKNDHGVTKGVVQRCDHWNRVNGLQRRHYRALLSMLARARADPPWDVPSWEEEA